MHTQDPGAGSSILRVRAEQVGSAAVVDLEGRLTVEADTRQLHELVRSMSGAGSCQLVLDLGKVQQLDCSGIGQLVQIHNQVSGSGGVFALVNVGRRQKRLLQLLGLLAVFRVRDSQGEHAITRTRARQLRPAAAGWGS